MDWSAMTQRSSDAPQNLREFEQWRADKNAWICDDYYLRQVDAKWRKLGCLAAQPASLRNAPKL